MPTVGEITSVVAQTVFERIVLLLLGLDNAGKSTLIATLRGEETKNDIPTWGFDAKIWDTSKFQVSVYDLGGGKSIRGIWPHYYAEAYGAIFVVDGADDSRLVEAAIELKAARKHPRLAGKPFLIVANKINQGTALHYETLLSALGPFNSSEQALVYCDCRLQSGHALHQELQLGVEWLLGTIKFKFKELQERVAFECTKQKDEEERSLKERREHTKSFEAEKESTSHAQSVILPSIEDVKSETHARMQAWIGPIGSDLTTCTYESHVEKGRSFKITTADFDKSLEPLIKKYEENSDEPVYSAQQISEYFGDYSVAMDITDQNLTLPGQPSSPSRV